MSKTTRSLRNKPPASSSPAIANLFRRGGAIVLWLVVIVIGVAAPGAGAAEPAWTWRITRDHDNVWLQSSYNDQEMFDYRIGAGGAVAEMRDVKNNYRRLLSPSYQGEVTDRIIQWTWWSDSITKEVADVRPFEYRFNVTQGGTGAGQISPTMSVEIHPRCDTLAERVGQRPLSPGEQAGEMTTATTSPNENQPLCDVVDIYSVPQDQWLRALQPFMRSKVSALTRYLLAPDGVLKIRRLMLVDRVFLDQQETRFEKLYVEAWTPFDRSGTFDGLALDVDADGNPTRWYKAGENIPYYPQFPVAETNGYAVVFKVGGHHTDTSVGVVFGKQQALPGGGGNLHVLNLMDWDNGVGVLPALSLSNVERGSVIDITIALLPRHDLGGGTAKLLDSLVSAIPTPVVHDPYYAASGELRDVVSRLTRNLVESGIRTEHIGGLGR